MNDLSFELVTKPKDLLQVDKSLAFHLLKKDTNLRDLPNHPIYGGLPWSHYAPNSALFRDERFNSFNMANHYLDLTGDIDVISDAENIKKLLKMPYSKSNVSLMVHRIGNTLMLDNFDIHRHLLRHEEREWKWLQKFFIDTILAGQMPLERRNRSRENLQQRNMLSRFLYHSSLLNSEATNSQMRLNQVECKTKPEEYHASIDQDKTLIWNFEDIRMLIGTDLPIFGGGTHPCVSLKLWDMKKPINVLTGLDYWLDNLMCNVPELAMCYHDDGIVKNYELLKTEDIPNITDCKFVPNVVKDVAQNILSFLKVNATKEGHTYWLLKGHDDDIVKLYDLTTLCSSEGEEVMNPFSTPVGFLLYRVARNMRLLNDPRLKLNAIVKLFHDSLQLLDPVKHVKVVSSAHYHLADLYIHDDLNSDQYASETESEYDDKDSNDQDTEDERGGNAARERGGNVSAISQVHVSNLCMHNNNKTNSIPLTKPPAITESMYERCEIAMSHILEGINGLHQSMLLEKGLKRDRIFEEQAKCDPSMAIPMQYKASLWLGNNDEPILEKMSHDVSTRSLIQMEMALDKQHQAAEFSETGWNKSRARLLRQLLVKKAIIVRGRMVELKRDNQNYGTALAMLGKAFKYYEILRSIEQDKTTSTPVNASLESLQHAPLHVLLHEMAGDLFLHIALNQQNSNVYESEYVAENSLDDKLLEQFDCDDFSENLFPSHFIKLKELNLLKSITYYDEAKRLSLGQKQDDIRIESLLANAYNELGTYYRNEVPNVLLKNDDKKLSNLMANCRNAYMKSLESFSKLEDSLNIHLVNSNLTQLLMIEAQISRNKCPLGQVTNHERDLYKKAQNSFENILKQLPSDVKYINLNDSINLDLAKISYRIAVLLQDYRPKNSLLSDQEIEQEIILNFKKALSAYDNVLTEKNNSYIDQSKTLIFHRLATLFHNSYRNGSDEKRRKVCKSEANVYYDAAYKLLLQHNNPVELLQLQLARSTFCQDILANQTSKNSKQKTLSLSMSHILHCTPAIKQITKQLEESLFVEDMLKETHKLISILINVLSNVLKQTIKIASEEEKVLLKSMYSIVLHLLKYEQEFSPHLTDKNKYTEYFRNIQNSFEETTIIWQNFELQKT